MLATATTTTTTIIRMTMTTSDQPPLGRVAFLRLLQLASPTLPIGAFAYSQGLEAAVTAGLVTDEASTSRWILGLLLGPVTHLDLPIFARVHACHRAGDTAGVHRWDAVLFASRATAELQAEDRHLASSLGRVLGTLGMNLAARASHTFVATFAQAAAGFDIDVRWAAEAFAFVWAEGQTSAAVRLVPLGQSAGVRMVAAAGLAIPGAVDRAFALGDDDLGAAAPLQAILSSAHETQYSRLFRS